MIDVVFVYLQANLNDSHNQMVVHWAGEKSNVIVALARDSVGATDPKSSSVSVGMCSKLTCRRSLSVVKCLDISCEHSSVE